MSQIDHEIENLLYQLDTKLDEFQFPQADEQLEISINLFLQILHHIFVNFDSHFYNFLIEQNFMLYSQDDVQFMESILQIYVKVFKQKPSITISQFFNNGFLKQKILFCIESANLIQKWIKKNKSKISKKQREKQTLNKNQQYDEYQHNSPQIKKLSQAREYDNLYQKNNQFEKINQTSKLHNNLQNQNTEYQNEYGNVQDVKPQNLHRYVESNCSVVDMNFNQKISQLKAPALFQKKENSQISQGSQNMQNSQGKIQYKKNQRFNTNDIDFGEMIKSSQEYEFNQQKLQENEINKDQTYQDLLVGLSQKDNSQRYSKQIYDQHYYDKDNFNQKNDNKKPIQKKSSNQSQKKDSDNNQKLLEMIKQTNENLVLLSKNVKKQLDTLNDRLANLDSRVTLIEKESKLNHTYH